MHTVISKRSASEQRVGIFILIGSVKFYEINIVKFIIVSYLQHTPIHFVKWEKGKKWH